MFPRTRLNTLRDQLRPIAQQNAQFMRQKAAEVAEKVADLPDCRRKRHEERYINQIEQQAVRWSQITVKGPR